MNMSVLIWLLCTVSAASLMIALGFVSRLWSYRAIISSASAALFIVGTVFLWSVPTINIMFVVLSLLQLFLIIVALRVRVNRLHEMHLLHTTLANSSTLIGLTGLIFILYIVGVPVSTVVIAILLSLGVIIWSLLTIWQIERSQHFYGVKNDSKDDETLPTVTLAIPARNEDQILTQTLHAAIVSTYPKLEVIVLDDCSHDRTSNLIKAFAHDGIRFITGSEPSSSWLGKTRALHELQQHASGEYIIFADVDTILGPDSVRGIVDYMRHHRLGMVSVLPQRIDGLQAGNVFRPLRYYFQLATPMSSKHTPTVSSLWCIKTSELKKLGGFESVKNRLLPEGIFARQMQLKDSYRFLVSNRFLGAHIAKKWTSQCETSIRLLYPSCRRQPIIALGYTAFLMTLLSPYVFVLYSALLNDTSSLWSALATVAATLLSISYAYYLRVSSPRIWPTGLITFPFLIAQEIALLFMSMLAYEFGEVKWKDRNVCYPVALDGKS